MARARPLQCPFCDNYLARPVDIDSTTMELTGGICICGGVYALDRSGHNLGEVFMDALTFACNGDIDRALSLNPEDYETVDYDYNLNSNRIERSAGRGRLSKIIFIRVKKEET